MINTALQKAMARLKAFKSNLPAGHKTAQMYIEEYHGIIQAIQSETGQDLEDLKIPFDQLSSIPVSSTRGVYGPGSTKYSEEKYCDRAFLMMRLDAAITFLSDLIPSPTIE